MDVIVLRHHLVRWCVRPVHILHELLYDAALLAFMVSIAGGTAEAKTDLPEF